MNDSDLRSSVTMKKRPKSSINTSNKKSKSRRDTDLYSTFNMKTQKAERHAPEMIRNGTQEDLSNEPIY